MSEETDSPTVTFGPSAIEDIIKAFNWTVDEGGVVVDEDNISAPSFHGEPVEISEVGGIVNVDGEPVLIRDNFADMVEYVSDSH